MKTFGLYPRTFSNENRVPRRLIRQSYSRYERRKTIFRCASKTVEIIRPQKQRIVIVIKEKSHCQTGFSFSREPLKTSLVSLCRLYNGRPKSSSERSIPDIAFRYENLRATSTQSYSIRTDIYTSTRHIKYEYYTARDYIITTTCCTRNSIESDPAGFIQFSCTRIRSV